VKGIAIRDELTDEWDKGGVKTNREFSILTAEISKAAFSLINDRYIDLGTSERRSSNASILPTPPA